MTTEYAFTIKLTPNENKLHVPRTLRNRVEDGIYTWKLYQSRDSPDNTEGRMGDIWLRRSRKRRSIHHKVVGGWTAWKKTKDDRLSVKGKKVSGPTHTYHPWLENRLLLLRETGLEWMQENQLAGYVKSWDKRRTRHSGQQRPRYKNLKTKWMVSFLNDLLSKQSTQDANSDPDVEEEGSEDDDSDDPDDSDAASSDTDASSARASDLDEADSSATLQYFDDTHHGGEREEYQVVQPLVHERKRARSSSSPSHDRSKRLKAHTSSGRMVHPTQFSVNGAGASDHREIEEWLGAQSMSLSHHSQLFVALGITELSYLRAIARLPKHCLDEFMAHLRQRGLAFVESLVARNALNDLYRSAQPSEEVKREEEEETIVLFLSRLHPDMARHGPLLRGLGIDIAHIPVLASLDTDSYAELEDMLIANELTWVELFLLKAGIQNYVGALQEPLLVG